MTKIRDLWNEDGYLIKKSPNGGEVRISGVFAGQEHLTKAEEAEMHSRAMNSECPTCSKLVGDHTPEEIDACSKPSRQP
jgi:hypothetical protein